LIAGAISIAAGNEAASIGLFVIAGILGMGFLGVGVWFFIEFGCLRGTIGANRYGPDPVRLH
jgi:uncharacterized membrane protein YhaH (DUF805 family)